ncbi:MAG: MotA/TolQ/ExbB proton channel family protein [Candidatus Symbiothrix sp.]|jgi:biopolymer transport protein ExbB|nr:MotA/TolQ/ExbB proton channel family protein [Candidatus Symbiothrix sp.]
MSLLLFIQDGVEGAATLANSYAVSPAEEVKLNVLDLAFKGGWVMIPIALLLLISVGIFIERYLVIKKASHDEESFMERIKDYIHDGNIQAAEKLCRKTNTPYARMIEKGVQRLGRPMNDILVAIENVGTIEIAKLEKGFMWIATTAAIAPMLGFFGTVTGMVRAFFDMANAGSAVDIALLSSGIYEALVTTVAGLSVGIPTLLAYNYLHAKVDGVMTKMETQTMDFMDVINGELKNKNLDVEPED